MQPKAQLSPVRPSGDQSRNRALTDIVAVRDAPLRLACVQALAGLLLLVRREDRLTAELDAVGLRIGSAARGAFGAEDFPLPDLT